MSTIAGRACAPPLFLNRSVNICPVSFPRQIPWLSETDWFLFSNKAVDLPSRPEVSNKMGYKRTSLRGYNSLGSGSWISPRPWAWQNQISEKSLVSLGRGARFCGDHCSYHVAATDGCSLGQGLLPGLWKWWAYSPDITYGQMRIPSLLCRFGMILRKVTFTLLNVQHFHHINDIQNVSRCGNLAQW